MTITHSADPAKDRVRIMSERIAKMAAAHPASISAKVLQTSIRPVCEHISEDYPEGGTDEAINIALMRYAAVYPGQFSVLLPTWKSLTSAEKLEFANTGVLPTMVRRRAFK